MTVVVTLCFLFTNFFFGWLSVCVCVGVKLKPTNDYEKNPENNKPLLYF